MTASPLAKFVGPVSFVLVRVFRVVREKMAFRITAVLRELHKTILTRTTTKRHGLARTQSSTLARKSFRREHSSVCEECLTPPFSYSVSRRLTASSRERSFPPRHEALEPASSRDPYTEGTMRFVVSFVLGLVAEIATGLVIGAGMLVTRGSGMPANPSDFPAWVPYVAMVAGAAFTFLFAWWRASRDRERAMAHAMLVALAAVALHLVTSIGAGQSFTALHVIADVCKLVAGIVAGLLARSRSARDIAPA